MRTADVSDDPIAPSGFRHEAFLYAGEDELVEHVAAFTEEGATAGEPTFVVVEARKLDRLRGRLGQETDLVRFADMATVGANPALIISAWRAFVDAFPAGQALRGVGEPVFAGRTDDEIVECERHEALLNVEFAASNLWLVCPYDRSVLDPRALEAAERTHPFVRGSEPRRSPTYPGATDLVASLDDALSERPPDAARRAFDADSLGSVRAWIGETARSLGLSAQRADDLVLAGSEVVTNSLRHGGGSGRVHLWRQGDAVLCDVEDRGGTIDPMAGRKRPAPGQEGGYGLWIANHLCDLVQTRSSPTGSLVRLHVASEARSSSGA